MGAFIGLPADGAPNRRQPWWPDPVGVDALTAGPHRRPCLTAPGHLRSAEVPAEVLPATGREGAGSANSCTWVRQGPQMVSGRGTEAAVLVPASEWRRLQAAARRSLKELLLLDHARTEALVPARGLRAGAPPPRCAERRALLDTNVVGELRKRAARRGAANGSGRLPTPTCTSPRRRSARSRPGMSLTRAGWASARDRAGGRSPRRCGPTCAWTPPRSGVARHRIGIRHAHEDAMVPRRPGPARFTVVTRNVADFKRFGGKLLNPFGFRSG